jgi:hypothetical protein
MPIAVAFEEPSTFRVRSSGAITYAEIEQAIGDLERDPRLNESRMLVDARGVSDLPSTSELRIIAIDMGRLVQRGLGSMAIVTETTFVYGVVRMFATFAEAVSLRVHPFRCMSDAERWLAGQ